MALDEYEFLARIFRRAGLPSVTTPRLDFSVTYVSGVEFQMETQIDTKILIFHVVDLQRTALKCEKFQNARAELLLCPIDVLFFFVSFPRCRRRRGWLGLRSDNCVIMPLSRGFSFDERSLTI